MVQDAQDFQEFLEQKDGKWDYLEDGLMELASCETCVTVYLPEDAQGAEMLAALRTMLAQMKAEDTEHQYGRLEAVCSGIREEDWANNWKMCIRDSGNTAQSRQAGFVRCCPMKTKTAVPGET